MKFQRSYHEATTKLSLKFPTKSLFFFFFLKFIEALLKFLRKLLRDDDGESASDITRGDLKVN